MSNLRSLRYRFGGVLGLVALVLAGCSSQKPTGERVSSPAPAPASVEAVKITSLEPAQGPRGATVLINGDGFSDDPTQLVVQFGATRAAIKNSGHKVIAVEVPSSIVDGKYNVTVTNARLNQTSGSAEFIVQGGLASSETEPRGRSSPSAPALAPSDNTAPAPAASPAPAARADQAEPAEPRPAALTVPAGTRLVVRSLDTISSAKNNVGDRFELTLDEPLVVNGQTVARKGSSVTGRITQAKRSGRVKGRAVLGFTLVSLHPAGHSQSYAIRTDAIAKQAPGTKKRDAAIIGGGAGIGTAIGAIAGGGKGAAIGAAVGGGAGTGTVLATRGKEVEYPAETRFTFKLRAPLTVH